MLKTKLSFVTEVEIDDKTLVSITDVREQKKCFLSFVYWKRDWKLNYKCFRLISHPVEGNSKSL